LHELGIFPKRRPLLATRFKIFSWIKRPDKSKSIG
jgi:hypothetical protein